MQHCLAAKFDAFIKKKRKKKAYLLAPFSSLSIKYVATIWSERIKKKEEAPFTFESRRNTRSTAFILVLFWKHLSCLPHECSLPSSGHKGKCSVHSVHIKSLVRSCLASYFLCFRTSMWINKMASSASFKGLVHAKK